MRRADMKIDRDVENAVRKAYGAAVAGKDDRLDAALKNIADRGDDFAGRALELAVVIDAAALHAIHEGRPDEEQINALLKHFAETESWAGIDLPVARRFLVALADHTPVRELVSVVELSDVCYVMGGWLLSSFLPEGKKWTEFLDEIEDALESVEES
jgi:hypothetical protein